MPSVETHFADGRVERRAMTAAEQSAVAAAVAAQTTLATKRTNAITAVRAEVTRIKAITAGSRTSHEKAFLGLAYLVFSEE